MEHTTNDCGTMAHTSSLTVQNVKMHILTKENIPQSLEHILSQRIAAYFIEINLS